MTVGALLRDWKDGMVGYDYIILDLVKWSFSPVSQTLWG